MGLARPRCEAASATWASSEASSSEMDAAPRNRVRPGLGACGAGAEACSKRAGSRPSEAWPSSQVDASRLEPPSVTQRPRAARRAPATATASAAEEPSPAPEGRSPSMLMSMPGSRSRSQRWSTIRATCGWRRRRSRPPSSVTPGSSVGRTVTRVRIPMARATAGWPYTTACSPKRMALPGALATTSSMAPHRRVGLEALAGADGA